MPSLVQKAWHAMTDFETNFYVDHPAPTRQECEDHDMSNETCSWEVVQGRLEELVP